MAFTAAQLVWALVLGLVGGRLVGSGAAGAVFGALLLCAAVAFAVHGILWLRSRVVVSPARVEIIGPFRRRTIAGDQVDRFELGANVQGRPVAVLVLRSGARRKLYATLGWWGDERREDIRSMVAQMNAAAAVGGPETP